MNRVQTFEPRSVQGRACLVRDGKVPGMNFHGATVVDRIAGENRAQRIRLQTGEHAGEIRNPGEYDLIEWKD